MNDMLTKQIHQQLRLAIAVAVANISPAWAGNLPETIPSPVQLWRSIRAIMDEGHLLPGSTAYQPGSEWWIITLPTK